MTQYRKIGDAKPPWPKLRRWRPTTRLPGTRRAWVALAVVIVGYFAPLLVQLAGGSDFTGVIVGALICIRGAVLGWRARDSRGRGIAYTAVVLGGTFTFAYLILIRTGA